MRAVAERVPADVSAAAFWLVAGAIHPDAELTLRGVGVNPTRRAIVDLLRRMGARIDEAAHRRCDPDDGVGEPLADLTVRSSELHAIDVSPAEVAAAIDEIPILCLAATQAARPDDDPRRRRAAPQGIGPDRRDRRRPERPRRPRHGRRRRPDDRRTDRPDRCADRQPRRPPPGDDLRDRRSHRRRVDDDRCAGERRDLLSRLLQRTRRGAGMTKRVVLIGHPVAHSLSGAMQQAAFDEPGIDARYELWDRAADRAGRRDRRAPRRRLPRRQRHDPAQGEGRPAGRPPDRGGARHGRGQHDHPRGQAADRPQHRRARASRSPSTSSSASRRCRARRSSWAPAAAPGRSSTG